MSWLESESLAEILHRRDLARPMARELRKLAPDDQRDEVIARLDQVVVEHQGKLDRRNALAADVIAVTRRSRQIVGDARRGLYQSDE